MDEYTWTNVSYRVFDKTSAFKLVKKVCDLIVKDMKNKNMRLIIGKREEIVCDLCLNANNCMLGRIGQLGLSIHHMNDTHLINFPTEEGFLMAYKRIQLCLSGEIEIDDQVPNSVFKKRTLEWSAVQYFQFYSYLSQQQNMMQDYIRTSTYQRAVFANTQDFRDKVVLDVGAGSGILSFFAVQGGARKVFAVEASNMAAHCKNLVRSNKLTKKITVIEGKIEEISLPEKVDVIISEPMGYMLVNERMLETYIHARKFLKPDGRMFPSFANLYVAPFTDDALYQEQFTKANFWYQPAFHGVDLTCLRDAALREYFTQPVVDTFDISICMASPFKHQIDFLKASESELLNIEVPLDFVTSQAGAIHGLAFWFDVCFNGSQTQVWLSTSPTEPLTHWYQVRCLFTSPLFVQECQNVTGSLRMYANAKQSYDVEIRLEDEEMSSVFNRLDLKNPCFRYTGGNYQTSSSQPNADTSPTEAFFGTNVSNSAGAPPSSNGDNFPSLSSCLTTSTSASNCPGNGVSSSSCLGPAVSPQFMIGDYAAAASAGSSCTARGSGMTYPAGGGGSFAGGCVVSSAVSSSGSGGSSGGSGLVPHAAGVSIQPTTRGFHSVHMPMSTAPMPY